MNVYDKATQYGLYGLLEGTNRQSNGDTFFVDSNCGSNAAGYGDSWDAPYATVNYAVAQCTSGNGDVILVAAGHTESITATSTASGVATGQFCVDKGDVTILGMGRGTHRPTFTMTTAAAAGVKIVGSNANITLANLRFISDYTGGLTSMITASANNYGLTIENCEFNDDASNSEEYLIGITIASACEDVTIRGCHFYQTNGSSATAIIETSGTAPRLKIYDNFFRCDPDTAVLHLDTGHVYDLEIRDNIINTYDAGAGLAIACSSSSTGCITGNIIHTGLGVTPIIAAACLVANNTVTHTEGASAQPCKMLAGPGGTIAKQGVFYCDDGGNDSNDGLSWETAVATIGAAIDLCVADNGDTIYVGANHAQNITGANTATEFDVDCNGISIIGCGNGNDRPTFTFITDVDNAQCYVTGVDCRLENLRFVANIASLKECINVNADGLQIINCDFDGNTHEPLAFITVDTTDTTGGSRLLIKGCTFDTATGDTDWGIHINKDEHYIRIEDNVFRGEYDVACVCLGSSADASTYLMVKNNYMENEESGIPLLTISGVAVTGEISGNVFVNDTRDEVCSPSKCAVHNNHWVDYAASGGKLTPLDDPTIPSEVFFVDGGATRAADAVGSGRSWDEPFATIDYAIAYCTANQGAEIHVAPGHTETVSTPSYIDIDVAGISIIGHGRGTDRPTLTFDTGTDSTFEIASNNFYIENFIFVNTQDALVVGFPVAGTDCHFHNCEFRDAGADNTIAWIIVADTAHRFKMTNCTVDGTDTAGNTCFISLDGVDHPVIKDCIIHGDYSDGCITFITAASEDILIDNCVLENPNSAIDSVIQGIAGLTGHVRYCSFNIADDTEVTWFETPGAVATFECYGVNNTAAGEAGKFVGTVSV